VSTRALVLGGGGVAGIAWRSACCTREPSARAGRAQAAAELAALPRFWS